MNAPLPRRRSRRAPRGAAVVEMALGAMVFVTILMFGIFFAEISVMTLKVQEANNFAVWDATGRPVHDIEGSDWQLLMKGNKKGAVPLAEKEAQQRYRDFDGRGGEAGGRSMALARARPIDVECRRANVMGTDPDDSGSPDLGAAMSNARGDTGIACTARSVMGSVKLPSRFLDKGAFFKEKHWSDQPIPICGIGRAKNGNCAGRLTVLLDDWALQTRRDSLECALNIDSSAATCGNPNGNQSYYNWTQRVYREFGGTGNAGSALVGSVKGSTVNETQFFMSFRGGESQFTQDVGSFHGGGNTKWETTPFKAPNITKRKFRAAGWLGHKP